MNHCDPYPDKPRELDIDDKVEVVKVTTSEEVVAQKASDTFHNALALEMRTANSYM